MQRLFLPLMQFCLAAWAAIAVFFFVVVVDLRMSKHFGDETKLNHPKVLFPRYYQFEAGLLAPAFVCACAGFWNAKIGRARRIALLLLVSTTVALAAWDYGLIYQKLAPMLEIPPPLPPEFHALHRMSRWLNEGMLTACAAAAVLALIPERATPTESS
ncbi:MAG: hypothetical protein HY290_20790 [Planctomycetia bacterium]|nr:hypothetical protein [Planctomycetia bacterium]